MADKFPEIDTHTDDATATDSDFLSREKELVGDEFATDQDKVLQEESDEEINDFKEQFPEVDGSTHAGFEQSKSVSQGDGHDNEDDNDDDDDDDEFEGFESKSHNASTSGSQVKDLSQSEPIKEWKQRRDLEIEEREKVNSQKKQDILKKAQSTIDDFYENYNAKKETGSKKLQKEEEEFLKKRDGFLKNGTLWDRVYELIEGVGELNTGDKDKEDPVVSSRDKSRFNEVLKKLKGKADVPGAGGYQE
ncbi:Clathrin light chain [Lodderomyces elongisporus]|uniref:Clathrin light chain n=1 Tax=Lodderomyces elongisporus TaxID=36914 RepID=UPI0029266492|nr:Clathrin light chain [Lodderomyces elongisporus]WLF80154.1 Clathrin light chain [Lodderomyces elongisporus]